LPHSQPQSRHTAGLVVCSVDDVCAGVAGDVGSGDVSAVPPVVVGGSDEDSGGSVEVVDPSGGVAEDEGVPAGGVADGIPPVAVGNPFPPPIGRGRGHSLSLASVKQSSRPSVTHSETTFGVIFSAKTLSAVQSSKTKYDLQKFLADEVF
jgi:hypothetical protein